MSEKNIFYITTPLYYVNAKPHIGHAYTTLAADILRRFKKMRGEPVYLLTGTDEHGAKIEEAAKAVGKEPPAYADDISRSFRDLWKHLDVHYDDFIRTTEPRHENRVQAVFQALQSSNDIYKGKYIGCYCVSDETYWTETEAPPDGKGRRLCPNPDCRKPLKRVEEESYFFALSRYQDRLLDHYRQRPEFLRPSHRANEILRFVESGLRDLSISRTKVAWGIRVPGDEDHTIYVWFDALLNYITAAGYCPPGMQRAEPPSGRSPKPRFSELWPASVQLVGKEIYRFHAVIWPAMLMALGLPLPRTVFAHGWWTVDGDKMSKSKGNFVDPYDITREFGVDAFRYFLFREMPFGNDGNFSRESLRKRYNAELANDLGNLLSRVVKMVDKYIDGELPGRPPAELPSLFQEANAATQGIHECMEQLAFNEALNRIWAMISKLNETIDKQAPWKLAESDPKKLKLLLFDLVRSLRVVAGWIGPFMPQTAAKMQTQLGVRQFPSPLTAEEVLSGSSASKIHQVPPLFPRK